MGATARARRLRKSMTPAEARLWLRLRALRAEGLHFRRQHPERGYILDFVCLRRGLVVEVDGGSHLDPDRARKDRVRDAVLGREGFVTMRVSNADVRDRVEEIIEEVRLRCRALPTRPPLRDGPPPLKGRET